MNVDELSFYMLAALVAMAVSMAITPLMMRLAPAVGMLDKPDGRKVHATVIPRVGGIGIVIGLLVPLFIWLDFEPFIKSLIFGCAVLLVFGAWDDARDLGPVVKFLGQFLAAATVVFYGDVYVFQYPFLDAGVVPEIPAKIFSVIAIVGMINALNLSDGLDGLAGGEALLSLAAITYLSYEFQGSDVMLIGVATMGGIFGFLRFNSHPARVFMGDGGSQTLGFILGVLVVYLSQNVNPIMSPMIAIFLLGLPVIDSLVVFTSRARRGVSLVIAAKDHFHHRLLSLGFYHYESVVIIYSIQIFLLILATLLYYESDILIFVVYASICFFVYSLLVIAEKTGLKVHELEKSHTVFLPNFIRDYERLLKAPCKVLEAGLSLFIIAAALMASKVPMDFGISAVVLLVMLMLVIVTGWFRMFMLRLIMYVAIGFSVYLLSTYSPEWLLEQMNLVYGYFIVITITAFVALRLAVADQFNITPLDYLVMLAAVIISVLPDSSGIVWMVIQITILFYACELVINNLKIRFTGLIGTLMLALIIMSFRGLL